MSERLTNKNSVYENQTKIGKMLTKLQELEDQIENGTLIRDICTPVLGYDVWWVQESIFYQKSEIDGNGVEVLLIQIRHGIIMGQAQNLFVVIDDENCYTYTSDYYYFTQAEAEAKLKELKNET